jgi:hypothetical protein
MTTHQIHVFISHSWSYSDHYNTLSEWIFEKEWTSGNDPILFHDYSVPRNDPIHDAPTDKALREAIYNKIRRSHVVVIPMGMYVSYSKWIQKEIDGSKDYSKPILAVNPRGQVRTPSVVQSNANHTVGWTSQSVVSGIWKLYRGE